MTHIQICISFKKCISWMTAIDSYENKDEKQQTQRLGLRLLKQG
jgi:hypothetical protein